MTADSYALDLRVKETLMKRATYASVGVAAFLIIIKFFAWSLSDSISLQATLVDSVLDVAASIINLFAVKHSLEPADKEHRFGHGKLEAISALGQALFITASAGWLLYEACKRIYNPVPLEETNVGIGVMVVAIIFTYFLLRFQRYVVRQTNSAAIKADSIHYQSDLAINLGVIFSLLFSSLFNLHWIDPLIGGVIALYILYTAWKIVAEAFNMLMDHELPEISRKKIREITMDSHPKIIGMHDLRTRSSGIKIFIQMHIELDKNMSLEESHLVAEIVEKKLLSHFSNAEVLIHQDPEGVHEKRDNF